MNRIRIIHGVQDPEDITKNELPTQDFVNFNFILNFFYKNNQVTGIFFAMEKKYRER